MHTSLSAAVVLPPPAASLPPPIHRRQAVRCLCSTSSSSIHQAAAATAWRSPAVVSRRQQQHWQRLARVQLAPQQQLEQQQQQQHTRHHTVTAAAASPPERAAAGSAPKSKLAVFVSGGGSNFKAIHAACLSGAINADVVAVVSDVPGCGGATYAAQHGIPLLTYPAPKSGAFPGLSKQGLADALTGAGVDYVLLAGFLKLVPLEVVRCFKRRMLNIHPGLLPSFGGKGFYGQRVHEAVLASGARFSGPTVHFVDEEYDTGPILAQRVVTVYPTDRPQQLAARVLAQEHAVYPHAVSALVDGRITWREDGIPIIWEAR